MPYQPGKLEELCKRANALYQTLVEATLRQEGGTAGPAGPEAVAAAIKEFHTAAEAVSEVPSATPAELAMKAQVARYYLSQVSSGRERKLVDSLINDAIHGKDAWGYLAT